MARMRTCLLGSGDIARRYADSLGRARNIDLRAIAGRNASSVRSLAQAVKARAMSYEEAMRSNDLDLLVILTPPLHHEHAVEEALSHGLHVYCEKPFALSKTKADALIKQASDKGVMLASAPATHLGPSLCKAREIVASGELGAVVSASASMVYPGPDLWHRSPDHLFANGGGPLWDMGVYHLNALVHLLGPVAQVASMGTQQADERTIRKGPKAGETIPVEVMTHQEILLRFRSGAVASATLSFDGHGSKNAGLQVIGQKGTLALGQPNDFSAPLERIDVFGVSQPVPISSDWQDYMWSIGIVESVDAFIQGREPIANAANASHIIELMEAIDRSGSMEAFVNIRSHICPSAQIDECSKLPWR